MLSHEMPQIIERINAFYGWAAVGRIRIVQRPVAVRPPSRRKTLRPLTGEEERNLEARLSGFEHDGLRKALKKLGSQVIAREKASQ